MLNMRPTNDNENGLLYLLTERKLNKLGYHVGQAPANGPIPSLITDVIHKTPAPTRTHLSATSALGLVTRAIKNGKAIPPRLLDALAEAFAADAVNALAEANKVKGPPKKDGKRYDRAKAEADRDWRVKTAEMLLRHYLEHVAPGKSAEEGLVYWVGDTTPKFSEDVAFTLRAQQGAEKMGIAHRLVDPSHNKSSVATQPPAEGAAAESDKLAAAAQAEVSRVGRQHVLRRLTPYECMLLQGFAPDHCMVPVSRCRTGKLTSEEATDLISFHAAEGRHYTKEELESFPSDAQQYACAGNSIAVVCLTWLLDNAAKAAAHLVAQDLNDNEPSWAAQINEVRENGGDLIEALNACMEDAKARRAAMAVDGGQPPAANDDVAAVMEGLNCGPTEARRLLELLASA